MGFHRENYLRLRNELFAREGRFNWWRPDQSREQDEGCVACAAKCLATSVPFVKVSGPEDIQGWLGCTHDESYELYCPRMEYGDPRARDIRVAIARLDAVAARYGVSPEPAPFDDVTLVPQCTPIRSEAEFVESCRAFAASVQA